MGYLMSKKNTFLKWVYGRSSELVSVFFIYVLPFFGMLYYLDSSFSESYAGLYQSVDKVAIKLLLLIK